MPMFEYKCDKCGAKSEFLEKAIVRKSTSAKNVEVRICRNYFRVFPLGRAARAIPAQQGRVHCLNKDIL